MGTLSVQPPSGAVRSLTEVFILLRNNAVQSRHIFAEAGSGGRLGSGRGKSEERMSLVPLHDDDHEIDIESGEQSRIPAEWVNMVDEVQYEMTRIRSRLKDLKEMEQGHLNKPSFNDDQSSDEERAIDAATQEITKMLSHCNRLIQHIKNTDARGRKSEKILQRNVTTALTAALQKTTLELRGSQTSYVRQLQSREDNFNQFFGEDSGIVGTSNTPSSREYGVLDYAQLDLQALERGEEPKERTMAQIQALEDNSSMVKEREREILHVTKSIVELNTLFKDLAGFVVDQGTVLDRIDYNIEQGNIRTKEALKQVRKAESYQRNNRKMKCIMILCCAILVALFLLVLKKSIF